MKVLPADLPREKILFIKYVPLPLERTRPKGYDRQMYGQQQKHNELLVEANEQLLTAAPQYPYAYRITTLDSVPYYHKAGYKYLLMEGFFNAYLNVKIGTANGPVPFYVSDLDKDDVYIFDHINSEAIYYYKYQMKLFLKKVDHQFHTKKE